MSLGTDFMVSTGVATSECDIQIDHNNTCKIIVAANDTTPGPQRLFYTDSGFHGIFRTPSVLPLVPGDSNHRHPSVEWTYGTLRPLELVY
jgi:hypothetical protein